MICVDTFKNLMRLGVDVDVIASEDSFEGYKVIVAPMLYMLKSGVADKLKKFVENGGHLLATYLTGYVDENQLNFLGGFPGDGLNEVFGVISEEIDSLYPSDSNYVDFGEGWSGHVSDYAEFLRVSTAKTCGTYRSDYYGGTPAVTENTYGKGKAYYVAARLEDTAMQHLFKDMLASAGVQVFPLPEGVERHTRMAEGTEYVFYLNCTAENQCVEQVTGTQLLTGEKISSKLQLEPYGVSVIL